MRPVVRSRREAAALAGLSPKTIYELCRLGVIRVRTVRGRWRVHRGDFAVWRGVKLGRLSLMRIGHRAG